MGFDSWSEDCLVKTYPGPYRLQLGILVTCNLCKLLISFLFFDKYGPMVLIIDDSIQLCSTLQNNAIFGPITDAIGKLQKLQTLDLSGNIFSGQLPSSLGDLKNLNFL